MPITPFHFGPGALVGVGVEGSFAAFVVANVIIDVESGYHLVTRTYPVHTFLHTFAGATVVAVATVVALGAIERWRRVHRAFLKDQPMTRRSERPYAGIVVGALAGAWSHVVLDGVMHGDSRPFAPWSDENPFYRLIGLWPLLGACVACAVVAGAIFLRQWSRVRC